MTVQVALFPPQDAVMAAVPAFTAVTVPLETVATSVLELVQVMVLSVAFEGLTVAVMVDDDPSIRVNESGFIVMEVTATVFSFTITVQVAVMFPLPPLFAFAVIVAVPVLLAVTLPVLLTEAMLVFELLQETLLSVALDGVMVAVN